MRIVGRAASLALLLAVAQAIRTLKEGPMIDAEGREYKSAPAPAPVPAAAGGASGKDRAVSPADVFLGEPRCRAAAAAADGEFVIEAELQDCGSKSSISGDSLLYSNQLVIAPAPRTRSITRLPRAVIPVSCRYRRTQLVSSSVQPSGSGRTSTFSLRLMTDDWRGETSSRVFYLGDMLRLQASYTGPDSGRRRLFIDSCVAALSPDTTSVPRYYFVENHGCLTDAKQGGRDALFRPRQRAHTLQLQLNAFLFQQDARNSACNYEHSRWKNVDGHDDACRCCDSTCYTSSPTRHNKANMRLLATKGTPERFYSFSL
uniref:Zona pellucida sperm-binding protein 3 n=1 Tax=Mola mola TaxID=94237 RepID=A0A3Q3VY79_MOLML